MASSNKKRRPGHYASKCPEKKNLDKPLMKAYLCGLQDGADGAPLPEPDSLTPIEQVKFRLQELSDGFNEQLRTMVGMITDLDQEEQDSVVDENPEGVEDPELDPSDQDPANVQNDEVDPDSDAESAYRTPIRDCNY